MSPFKYEPRPAQNWEKRQNQGSFQYNGAVKEELNQFRPHDNENSIRICPPTWPNAPHYGYDIYLHYQVGPVKGTVVCLSKMFRKPCPICEFQAQCELKGREDAKEYKPSKRVAVWLVDRKAAKPEEALGIWPMGWTVDRDITLICKDRDSGALYHIDNPTEGFDVYFDKKGKEIGTTYTGISLSRNPSIIEAKHLDFIAEHPIPDCFILREYDEVKYMFEGDMPISTSPAPASSAPPTSSEKPVPELPKKAEVKTKSSCPATMKIKGVPHICPLEDLHDGEHDFIPVIDSSATPVLTLTPQEFCSKVVTMKGVKYGCGLIGDGHKGEHDFSRELSNGEAGLAATTTTKKSTTELRARFETGQQ